MNRILLLVMALVLLPLSAIADEDVSPRLVEFHYFQTDKKGRHVTDYIIERNDRFNFYTLTIMTKNINSAFVLSGNQFEDVLSMLYELGKYKNDVAFEGDENEQSKNMWNLNFFIYSDNSLFFRKKGDIKNVNLILQDDDSPHKQLLQKINSLIDRLNGMAADFKRKYPENIIVLFYNSQGPNGLAGILRDQDGRIVDQTLDIAFAVSIDGPIVYSYAYGHIDQYNIDTPDTLIRQISDAVYFKQYVEPDEVMSVTDAAPPNYCILTSDAVGMSTNDEYKVRNNLIRTRYDVFGIEKLYTIIDSHTNILDTMHSHNPWNKSL